MAYAHAGDKSYCVENDRLPLAWANVTEGGNGYLHFPKGTFRDSQRDAGATIGELAVR